MKFSPFFSLNAAQISLVCKGRWIGPVPPETLEFSDFTDDSRLVKKGSVFLAIDGRKLGLPSNGEAYLSQAAQAGAVLLIASDFSSLKTCPESCYRYWVEDPLDAFHTIANACRNFQPVPVVAITGSCGKTSVKEMTASILEEKYPGGVLKTEGNTNNFFGVPRNLLRRTATTKVMVIEAGTNHPGEIFRLGRMIQPDISLVTKVGSAHLEAFENQVGVGNEKGDLFLTTRPDGICIYEEEPNWSWTLTPHLHRGIPGRKGRKTLTFGAPGSGATITAQYLGLGKDGCYHVLFSCAASGEELEFSWKIGGEAQAMNAAAACTIGIAMGMNLAQCLKGLRHAALPGSRLEVVPRGNCHWVNDAYNANPTSMESSLKWFQEASSGATARYLVLGEMRELGRNSSSMHRQILQLARKLFSGHENLLYTVGEGFADSAKELDIPHFPNADALRPVLDTLPEGSWIFLKGSNGVGLFNLIPAEK